MKTFPESTLLKLISACFLVMFFAASALSMTFEVDPDRISITSLYHGSKIAVTGETGADEDIIIKFSSPGKEALLRKKGKAAGMIWMNVGEIEFEPVPDVYLVYATKDIDDILSEKEQDRFALGYGAFKRIVDISPPAGKDEKEKWVNEFIRFKEKNGIYGLFPGSIETTIKNGRKIYKLTADWPYKAPPQEYKVSVFAVRDKMVTDHAEAPVVVEKVGALKFISNMAFNNSAAYGIVSIFIAIAAGFIVSVMFKGAKGAH